MPTRIAEFFELVDQLPDVHRTDHGRYARALVGDRTFGYLWPATSTVGLKQTLIEQAALVAERPDVFEAQFTAGGFGWVVVHLDRIDVDELSELALEAWYLTAPEELLASPPSPEALVRAG